MVCLTTNGTVRWKVDIESVTDMDPIGVSNIVSDRQGDLFYTASWSGDTIYTAKICRITNAQTSHPVQKCIVNYQLFFYVTAPLAVIEKYDLLVTAVSDNEFESVPLVLNKTTLDLLWVNRHFFGAGLHGDYRWDLNTGDLFWIGGDDRLLKFNYTGEKLINNFTQLDGFGTDFAIDRKQEVIVRPWQNGTSLPWKLLVSSHDVSTQKIKLRWNWHAPPAIADNDDITPPTIDENGTVYMSSMPLAFAIDSHGKTVWTNELATSSEMNKFELVSFCITMNSKRRIIYIVSGSPYSHKSNFLYFITAVHMDTGKIIKRIDLNLESNKSISPKCPILIGDEMFYFSWQTGQYPQSVPFKVTGIQQL
jgi:hypothetical protein